MPNQTGMHGRTDRELAASLVVVEKLRPALQQGHREKQVRALAELVEMRAPMRDQWQALAAIAADNGEVSLARRAMDLFVEAQDGSAQALFAKAALLERLGAHQDAWDLMSRIPDNVPDPASNAYARGMLAIYLGKDAEARALLEQVVTLQPGMGAAWLALAQTADWSDEDELGERIVTREKAMAALPAQQRGPYLYALGTALAARKDHGRAFAAFRQGGADMRGIAAYRREDDRRGAEMAVDGFTAGGVRELAARQEAETDRAIFIAGLPRSGTTLVDQILASHSSVASGGEINLVFQLVRTMRGQAFATIDGHVEARGAAGLARLWDHLLDQRFPGQGRIVDKSLNNTRFLGLAAAVLPDAPLVWITRDPLDRAWSCFRTFFGTAQPWSVDLEDIAFHFRLEDALLDRWRSILGERLLVVPFEELVSDPPGWIDRIARHCGLDPEPAMLEPHRNTGTVTTASVRQVRRRINRAGIGAAEPYRDFLRPFAEAYTA